MDIFDIDNKTEEFNFDTFINNPPAEQQKREYELQERAGIVPSADFKGTRSKVAQENYEKEMNNLYMASEDSLSAGADAATIANYIQGYINRNAQGDADVSLEVAAADNSVEEAWADNPQTASNAYNSAITEDEAEVLAKAEVLESWARENKDRVENSSWWEKFGAGASRVLMPFFGAQALDQDVFPFGKEVPFEFSSYTTRQRQQKYIDDFAKTHTTAEFKRFLDDVTDYMWNVKGSDPMTIEAFVTDMQGSVNKANDIFGAFEIGTPILRAVNNSIRAAKVSGNTKKAKEAIVNTLKQGTDTQTILEEVVTNSASKPFMNSQLVSYSNKVAEEIADTLADKRAMNIIEKYRAEGVFEEADLSLAKQLASEEFKVNLNKDLKEALDINAVDIIEDESGSYLTSITIGTGINGDAAMDDVAAIAYAKRLGLPDGSYKITKQDGEGLYIQYFTPLKDKALKIIGDNNAVEDWSLKGFGRIFAGVVGVSEKAHAKDIQATRFLTAMRNRMHETYSTGYHKLNSKDREALNTIYKKGQKANAGRGVWYNEDQLRDLGATEDMVKAYKDFRTVSDIEYITNNDKVRRELSRQGYMLSDNDLIIKEANPALLDKNFNSMSIKIGDNLYNSNNITADTLKKEYIDKGYKLIQVSKRSQLQDDLNYNYMLVPAEQFKATPLPRFITNYAPGGRRKYTYGTAFVKIGRRIFSEGKEMNGFAKTLTSGTDIKALRQYADEVNRAIEIAKRAAETGNRAEADRAITEASFKYFKVNNWEDLEKLIRSKDNPKGIIDTNYKATVLEDGESLIYDNNLDTVYDGVERLDDALQDILDTRYEFSRHRGNLLDAVNGDEAKILNINEIFDKTINKAAYNNAIGNLHNWYGREFRKNFIKYVDTSNGFNPNNYSDQELIKNAKILPINKVPAEDRDGVRAALNMQSHYLRISNAQTPYDKYVSRVMTAAARSLGDYVPGMERDMKVLERLASTDPAKAARAMGFQAVMGWWNPAQLYKQALGVTVTAAMEPLHATRAFLAYPFIRLGYRYKDMPGLRRSFSKFAVKAAGITSEDFENIIKYMDQYGSLDGTKMLVGMDAKHAAFLSRSKIINSQYFFMNAGTNLNYIVSDITAYLAMKGKGKSFKDIAEYSDDLYLNMTKASESNFQAGQKLPTTVFAQWLTYPTRLIESMFNKRLSRKQRASILLSQIALWGAAGTLGDTNTELNIYKNLVEDCKVSPDLAGFITSGLMQQLGKEYGVVVDESLHLKELIEKEFLLYDAARGEFNMPSIPASVAFSQVASIYNAIKEAVAPETGEFDFYNWLKDRATDRYFPSGPRNLAKAVVAYHTGKFFNNHKEYLRDNATNYDAIKQLLGFQPYEQKEMNYLYEALADYKTTVEDFYKELEPLLDQINAYDESGGIFEDPHRREQEQERLINRYNKDMKAYRQILKETYPDSKAADLLERMLIDKMAGADLTIASKRQEVYKKLGPGYLKIIQSLMKGNYNVSE